MGALFSTRLRKLGYIKTFFTPPDDSECEVDMPGLIVYLNSLEHSSVKIEELFSLTPNELESLWKSAKGLQPNSIDEMIPLNQNAPTEVIFVGKNSLLGGGADDGEFQLRMCRSPYENVLWGFQFVTHLKGSSEYLPFYFVGQTSHQFEVELNYNKLPPSKLPFWPEILDNSDWNNNSLMRDFGLPRMNRTDVIRKVADDVFVGHCVREGKGLGVWFTICRQSINLA